MEAEILGSNHVKDEDRTPEVVYDTDKDFYKGIGGELRLKAEGLFKKAKEKGISIEEITITALKENQVEFPGIGNVELPAFIVKVKGLHAGGQTIIDGKQIDYYNRYQRYVAERIEKKNILRDEKGKTIRENGRPKVKNELELALSEWERFEIGKDLIDDKEFGLEKTITGACDRVIRKLMGENDWLYPDEARLLDEEFNKVQNKIAQEQEARRQGLPGVSKKATERQISYLKAKIKNSGMDPENSAVIREILRLGGFDPVKIDELSTGDMSKLIDSIGGIIPKVRDAFPKQGNMAVPARDESIHTGESVKQ